MEKKKNNSPKSKNKLGEIFTIGASVVAVAATGYFLFGPKGKKHRQAIKGWTLKMKGEVLEKIEQAKEISEPVYNKIVDTVANKYLSSKNKKEVEGIVKELKKHWTSISRNIKNNPKKKK